MTVWTFFGVEEDGAGTGGGRDVAVSARGALAAAGAGAIGATAPDVDQFKQMLNWILRTS
jgi:hypothetical protein